MHPLVKITALSVVVSTVIWACAPVSQEEILGKNEPPARVDLKAESQPPVDKSVKIAEVDDNWAEPDGIDPRLDNMLHRSEDTDKRFQQFVGKLVETRGFSLATQDLSKAEANAGASKDWWDKKIYERLNANGPAVGMSLQDVVSQAVSNSHQIRAFGLLPAIRQTAIREADGRFTPEFFAEGQVDHTNNAATSPSLTAGESRLRSTESTLEFGVRSRVRTGAEVTLAQRFSNIDTNQTDFIPGQQAASRTTLTLIQPILRGSGLAYNNAPTRIAELDTKIAQYELIRQSENHLLEVERAYWNLYVTRANLVLAKRLARAGRSLAGQAQARRGLQTAPTIIIRTNAARKRWEADIIRAEAAVKNAQFRLASLTNSNELAGQSLEIIPMTPPTAVSPKTTKEQIVSEMLSRRPELQQAFLQYRAATLREGVAANENLPELDVILEGRLDGRDRDLKFDGAFQDSGGDPGGMVGVRFSMPIGYDEREARYDRRRLETIQQRHQVRAAISTVLLEVEVSASEYAVAAQDLTQQRAARAAAQRELSSFQSQWRNGGGASRSAILSELVDAHDRANSLERAVVQARATLAVAAANFSRARGVLLDRWNVTIQPGPDVRDEPRYRLSRSTNQ